MLSRGFGPRTQGTADAGKIPTYRQPLWGRHTSSHMAVGPAYPCRWPALHNACTENGRGGSEFWSPNQCRICATSSGKGASSFRRHWRPTRWCSSTCMLLEVSGLATEVRLLTLYVGEQHSMYQSYICAVLPPQNGCTLTGLLWSSQEAGLLAIKKQKTTPNLACASSICPLRSVQPHPTSVVMPLSPVQACKEISMEFPEHRAGACGLLVPAHMSRDDWTCCAEGAIIPLVSPIWGNPFL